MKSALVLALLIICFGAHSGIAATNSGVLATVNREQITTSELKLLLQRLKQGDAAAPGEPRDASALLRQLILMRLLAQEVAADPAFADARTQKELALSKLLTVRDLYLERIAARRPPDRREIQRLIQDSPQFFANRRLFYFEDLRIEGNNRLTRTALLAAAQTPTKSAGLESQPQQESAGARLAAYAEGRGARVSHEQGWKFSEELDAATLAQLTRMTGREVYIGEAPDHQNFRVLVLHAAQNSPLHGSFAERLAAEMLLAKRKQEASDQLFDQLSAKAKIEYVDKPAPLLSALPEPRSPIAEEFSSLPAVSPYYYVIGGFLLLFFADRALHMMKSAQAPDPEREERLTACFRSYRWCSFFVGVLLSGASLIVFGRTSLEMLAGAAVAAYGLQGLYAECLGVRVYESYITLPRRWAETSAALVLGRSKISTSDITQLVTEPSHFFGDVAYVPTHTARHLTQTISTMDDRLDAIIQAISGSKENFAPQPPAAVRQNSTTNIGLT